ncbi:DNA methyltransferase [Flagellimonas flava]|uniref:DNA methylase n=1 Tax=Flagellimonas flava TaxID=570519 RepID=A0A1M5IDL1_9FLAO|nr:DNA methyltransferase [Allomuricauda flava]SHG26396.1 DNA methylase [Allomuricauda flava]
MILSNKFISEIGVSEKYLRDEHYNSMKVWWARRPIRAMRALLINESIQLRNSELDNQEIDFLNRLAAELNPSKKDLKRFSSIFNTSEINILDVFAGGGSIPFESARLGFKTFSSELNPVASLLQHTLFDSLGIENFGLMLENSGSQVIKRLEDKYSSLYNFESTIPYVIFWSKTANCKSCGGELELRRLRYFSKKKNKLVTLDGKNGRYKIGSTEYERERANGFTCPACGVENSFKDIKEYCNENTLGSSPLAICYYLDGKKTYKSFDSEMLEELSFKETFVQKEIKRLSEFNPKSTVRSRGGVINPTLYDLKYHQNFFNDRQLLILLGLIEELTKQYHIDVNIHGKLKAKQILLGLTCLIEFLVDWNSNGTMWISQNEQTGRSLAGPGVGMKWDYIEVNPFFNKGSNLKSKLNRVVKTYTSINRLNKVDILKGSSEKLNLKDGTIDMVLTDPPYFDSVDYTALSEFFRPWFEILIANTYDKSIDLRNDASQEAIVELTSKKNGKHRSSQHYERIMTNVLRESYRVLKNKGKMLMLYSHKTFEGWEIINRSITDSGFKIDSCIPLEMERIARPRAMNYEALNGVIVFRLTKETQSVSTAIEDVNGIHQMMVDGELKQSQVVIYLAALACKLSNNEGLPFKESYDELIKLYEEQRIKKWSPVKLDTLTTAFLEYKLSDDQPAKVKKLLKSKGLINENTIKDLSEINSENLPPNSVLKMAIEVFSEFENSSKTKINKNQSNIEKLNFFFSVVGGLRLNTLSRRSNRVEEKVSRMVLSKLSEI